MPSHGVAAGRRSLPVEVRGGSALQEAAREDRALDLARPLPDAIDAELAEEPRRGALDHVSTAPSACTARSAAVASRRRRPRGSPPSPSRVGTCGPFVPSSAGSTRHGRRPLADRERAADRRLPAPRARRARRLDRRDEAPRRDADGLPDERTPARERHRHGRVVLDAGAAHREPPQPGTGTTTASDSVLRRRGRTSRDGCVRSSGPPPSANDGGSYPHPRVGKPDLVGRSQEHSRRSRPLKGLRSAKNLARSGNGDLRRHH